MTDPVSHPVKAPWHLWVVGVAAVLWNTMGVLDFTMTQLNNEAWLKQMTPEQLAYIHEFPLWSVVGWGAGVYGGFIGSILLLFRTRWAAPVFMISIAGVFLTTLYSYVITDSIQRMGAGPGPAIFSIVIIAIAGLLWSYAYTMTKRGVLR